jgi:hypothetical protein
MLVSALLSLLWCQYCLDMNILFMVYIATKFKCYKDPLFGNPRRGDIPVIVELIMDIFGMGVTTSPLMIWKLLMWNHCDTIMIRRFSLKVITAKNGMIFLIGTIILVISKCFYLSSFTIIHVFQVFYLFSDFQSVYVLLAETEF